MRQPRRVRAGRSRRDGSNRCNRANRVSEGVHVLGAVSVGLGASLTTLPLHYGDSCVSPVELGRAGVGVMGLIGAIGLIGWAKVSMCWVLSLWG